MYSSAYRRLCRCLAACLVSFVIAACGQPPSGDPASAVAGGSNPSATASVIDASTTVDPDSPCRLLTDAEVRSVFPGAKASQPERSREEYGIKACEWSDDGGRFMAEIWNAKDSTAESEIKGLAEGFIDPVNPGAASNVRYEPIAGVGEQAFAVVENRDAQRGILDDVALLVARKNDRILVLLSDDLAHRDRAVALRSLTDLGSAAAKRL